MQTGRPPIFNSPEEMQVLIDKYFDDKEEFKTICGLALALGFNSRGTIYEYGKKKAFSDTIKRAMLRIEGKYEERVNSTSPAGPIFVLKNMGWTDSKSLNISGIEPVIIKDSDGLKLMELGSRVRPLCGDKHE